MVEIYEHRFPWNLDWNLLRTFMVVVDQRGITRAANFLGVQQPTISSALKRLEDTVGERLVDRRPNHFSVTEAGEIIYRESKLLFGAVSQIPDLMKETENRVSGHVGIAMTSHVISTHLDDTLRQFNEDFPDVTYAFAVSESTNVLNRVRQNEVTLGFCLMREPDPNLRSSVLYRQEFGLYCGPSHRLFGRTNVKASELQGEPSVSFQTEVEDGPLHSVAGLRERALLSPATKGVSANLPELRRMVVAGIGIGALPVHIAQRDVDAGLLWPLPPQTNLPSVAIHVVTNPKRSMNPAERAFVTAIDAMLESVPLSSRSYP